VKPEQLSAFRQPSDPRLHPDGTRTAFTVSQMDLDDDRYERRIWLWDGSDARPFTHGPADSRPRWSPDGTRLAFLRATGEEGEPPEVAVMSADGGEATVVTDFALGATEAEWSPDGTRLAVIGKEWVGEWADLGEEDRKKHPRRITGPLQKADDAGWVHDRRSNVYLVDPDGGADPVALTDGDVRDSWVVWRPDGSAVGFMSARHDRAYFEPVGQAWEVPVAGGDAVPMSPVGFWVWLNYDHDGDAYVIGIPGVWGYPASLGLYRTTAGGVERLAADLDRSFGVGFPPVPGAPHWTADGSGLAIIEDRGAVRVIRVSRDGSWEDVAGGNRVIGGLSSNAGGTAFAFTAATTTEPGDLWWWEDGAETRLTDLNPTFAADAALVEPEHFTVERDGTDLDVWVYLPPGDGKVPALLNIHGGPASQYGWGFFDEFQVYAGAGYGVVACNPRGSSGRGTDFVRTPIERWAEDRPPDLEDIMAAFDAALERFDRLDAGRQGIMGGSYGGFMTARILPVEPDRFRSAVPERGLYSFTSFAGTSDIGFTFPRTYLGQWDYEQDWHRLWEASPLSRAHRIETPCLIIHSENDFRCPISQAEQLYAVLADRGVEVEFLRFPGNSHELSRSGTPSLRKARFEAILDWHGRHL